MKGGGAMTERPGDDQKLRAIAAECREFEHIISAMGYGYSLLNVGPDNFVRRCSDCVHWDAGHCAIYQSEIRESG